MLIPFLKKTQILLTGGFLFTDAKAAELLSSYSYIFLVNFSISECFLQ